MNQLNLKRPFGLLFFLLLFASVLYAQQNPKVFKEDNLSGVKDANGDILIPPQHTSLGWSDSLNLFVDNVIGYYDNNWGLISAKNKIITAPEYYELWPINKDLIVASKKSSNSNHLIYGALNSKGNSVVDFKYSSIDKLANLLIVTENIDGKTKYGLLNDKKQFLLKPEYSKIEHFVDELYVFSDHNKSGIIKKSGETVIPLSLDSIGYLQNGKAKIFDSGKTGVIDQSGSLLFEPKYKSVEINGSSANIKEFHSYTIVDHLNTLDKKFNCDSVINISESFYTVYFNHHLSITDRFFKELISGSNIEVHRPINNKLILTKAGKYGVINDKANTLIPMEYDFIEADENYFYARKKSDWFVFNKFGRQISDKSFEDLLPQSENLIATKRNGYWGFIDFQGDEAIPYKFDEVSSFDHLTSRVKFLNGLGTINQFGEWICQPTYDDITIHKDGITEARLKSRIDLIDHDGNVIFQTYNKLTPYDGGFIEETAEGKIGFIMRDGRIVKHPIFDEISFTSKDSILIAREDKYLSLATKGGDRFYSLSGRFEEVLGISEDLVGIRLDDKYGFVDLEGRLRIANRYDSIKLFSNGMAAFFLRGNWGYIDKAEILRVQPIYDSSFDFINNNAIVIEKGKYGVIDKDGKYLMDSNYDKISRNQFGSFDIELDGKFGLYDAELTKVASVEFSETNEVSEGQVIVKRRGLFGVLNGEGRFTIPLMYNNIAHLKGGKYMVVSENKLLRKEKLK